MQDRTGDLAVSRVDRYNEILPLKFYLEVADVDDATVKVAVVYHSIKATEKEFDSIEFLFNKEKILSPLANKNRFEIPNVKKHLVDERDEIHKNIDRLLKQTSKEYSDHGYSRALEKLFASEDELRKAAMNEAIIWLLNKPKGWDGRKSLPGFAS